MVLEISYSNKLIVYRKSTKYLSYINYTPLTHTAFQAFENIFKRNLKLKYIKKKKKLIKYYNLNIFINNKIFQHMYKQTLGIIHIYCSNKHSLISYEPEIIKV
jgi:hypothetical protein